MRSKSVNGCQGAALLCYAAHCSPNGDLCWTSTTQHRTRPSSLRTQPIAFATSPAMHVEAAAAPPPLRLARLGALLAFAAAAAFAPLVHASDSCPAMNAQYNPHTRAPEGASPWFEGWYARATLAATPAASVAVGIGHFPGEAGRQTQADISVFADMHTEISGNGGSL